MRIKFPSLPVTRFEDDDLHKRVADAKAKMKSYADDRRNAKPSDLAPGDTVLVEQRKRNKTTPIYDSEPFLVVNRKGPMVTARRGQQEVTRNSSYFKRIDNRHMQATPLPERAEDYDSGATAPPPIPMDNPPTPILHRSPTPVHMPQTPARMPIATSALTPRCARRLTMPSVPSTPMVPTTPVVHERPTRIKQNPKWQKDYNMTKWR